MARATKASVSTKKASARPSARAKAASTASRGTKASAPAKRTSKVARGQARHVAPAKAAKTKSTRAAKPTPRGASRPPVKKAKAATGAKLPAKKSTRSPARVTARAPAKPRTPSSPAKAPAKAALAQAKPAPPSRPATSRPAPRSVVSSKPVKPKPRRPLDKFLLEQQALLRAERDSYERHAEQLKAEADQLATEMEPGESEFSEEGGEGGNLSVERELDLRLSAQARNAAEEIERALAKIDAGTYGICEKCGQPIPRLRLKALPAAPLCVACKSGGLSRR